MMPARAPVQIVLPSFRPPCRGLVRRTSLPHDGDPATRRFPFFLAHRDNRQLLPGLEIRRRYRTTITAGGDCLEARSTYRKPDEKSFAWLN